MHGFPVHLGYTIPALNGLGHLCTSQHEHEFFNGCDRVKDGFGLTHGGCMLGRELIQRYGLLEGFQISPCSFLVDELQRLCISRRELHIWGYR